MLSCLFVQIQESLNVSVTCSWATINCLFHSNYNLFKFVYSEGLPLSLNRAILYWNNNPQIIFSLVWYRCPPFIKNCMQGYELLWLAFVRDNHQRSRLSVPCGSVILVLFTSKHAVSNKNLRAAFRELLTRTFSCIPLAGTFHIMAPKDKKIGKKKWVF
jgi:hypothetical protein